MTTLTKALEKRQEAVSASADGSNYEALNKDIDAVRSKFKGVKQYEVLNTKEAGVFKAVETPEHKLMRMEVMKTALNHPIKMHPYQMRKSSLSTSSNLYGYDLRAPSLHLVPWLSPIRESLPRVHRSPSATQANWKYITPATFTRGGFPSVPFINEGQRAPLQALTFSNGYATYASIGVDSSVTFEEESASQNFEDALATSTFFALENLMVKEEDALVGADKTLKLGQANTPTGVATGSGSFTENLWCAVVELTYEGYRNFTQGSGTALTQQLSITTPDGKPMQVNGGCGQASAVSAEVSPSSSASATFSVIPKNGAVAWLWYIGSASSSNSLYLQGVTTVPSVTLTSASITSTQALSALAATDFSVNDGSTGGGANQVTGFDGFLTQTFTNSVASPVNAYVKNLNGATLTSSGAGGVQEIDNLLLYLWQNFKATVDEIYVNAQELKNITAKVLNGSSAPLLRVNKDADSGEYDLTGSGTISFYFNPYIPGGRKITIMVHPTLPPGTLMAYAKTLPPYFKTNSTPNVAEVLTRRDYYSQEFAITSREYPHGVYAEEVLAVYFPPSLAVITGIGNG
jgi:hypothetical protein